MINTYCLTCGTTKKVLTKEIVGVTVSKEILRDRKHNLENGSVGSVVCLCTN